MAVTPPQQERPRPTTLPGRPRRPRQRRQTRRFQVGAGEPSRFRLWLRRIASALALSAVGVAYFVPERARIPLALLAAAGGVLFISALSSPRNLLRWVTHRPYLYRFTNFLYAVAGTAVVVASVGVVDRAGLVWDLGGRGRIVVAEATVLAARGLPGPPELRYYPSPDLSPALLERSVDFLRDLEGRVPGSRVHVLDPVREVESVKADGIVMGGPDLIVETAGRIMRLHGVEERVLQDAFERLARGGGVVCAFVGHGERDAADAGPRGLSQMVGVLEASGWSLGPMPTDLSTCEVLLIAAPERRIPRAELDRVSRFIAGGGRLLVFLEPGIVTGLEPLLAARGVDVLGGSLRREMGPSPLTVRGIGTEHPTLGDAVSGDSVWAHGAVSIGVRDSAEALVWTEPHVRAVDDLTASPGPFVLAAATTWSGGADREGRALVLADVDLASNRALAEGGNRELLVAGMRWLVSEKRGASAMGLGEEVNIAPGAWAFVAVAFLMLGLVVQRRWERA